jgi:16S rRNA C967 or C1407 C5-methylase (RsmB/RsmF family)/NOL1/NOP2/fmu family ribosome biogenesis protein
MSIELPSGFLSQMKRLLVDEYGAFVDHYNQPPEVGLRVNTLKLSPERFERLSPFSLTHISWSKAGYLVSSQVRPGGHPFHSAGLYYLQDPSAMAVVELLAPQPGERVLDLAAAPGGKSTHIAAMMQGEGLLVVNDLKTNRAHSLARNLDRWGTHNAVVLNETPSRLAAHFGSYFDRVLVDAPCSGESTFRKDPTARAAWAPQLVERFAGRQKLILDEAAQLVRPGGILGYATCTFSPQENEGVIARFLAAHPEFEVLDLPHFSGFSRGRPDWLSGDGMDVPELKRTVRLWPHKAAGDGHFIAILEKSGGGVSRQVALPAPSPKPLTGEARERFAQFCGEVLNWLPSDECLAPMGVDLYCLPLDCPDLRGLRVLRWGWWLGTLKKKRFVPSQALGMGLRAEDVSSTLPLGLQDPAVEVYLRGDVLSSPGEDGWLLVTLEGFPLGWGKRVHKRIKPHFPSWLRQF